MKSIIPRNLRPRVVIRQVRHPHRPVSGPLLQYPDGHFSVRARFLGTHHGVSQRDAAAIIRAIRSRKAVANV